MSKCLIISYGPIPTKQYQKVEGGGMRVYGLAMGLMRNGIDVTVSINESYPQDIPSNEGIKLTNWKLDNNFIKQLNSFDSVIASYSLGDASIFIKNNINNDIQFIIDAYVPSYIEVPARESHNIKSEYINYFRDLPNYNDTLKRGDYFLTANKSQELLYMGVLGALGVINPASFRAKRIQNLPFGIHDSPANSTENPYDKLGYKEKGNFIVLWFGGMYPWFRIEEYLHAIKELSSDRSIKFVFVGAKNPLNGHPDFEKQYNTSVDFVKNHKLQDTVTFVDWVDFDSRVNWFKNADIIISLNQPSEENKFSWRTRVMDFIWGDAVILTNGGDPLSDELIESRSAILLPNLSTNSIVESIKDIRSNNKKLIDIRKNINTIKPKYYWHNITKDLSNIISEHKTPFKDEVPLRNKVLAANHQPTATKHNIIKRSLRVTKKTIKHIKAKGLKNTVSAAQKTLSKRLTIIGSEPQYIFISHPIDNTGAPLVLINIIEDFVEKYGSNRIRVIAPSITENHRLHLKKLGINVEKLIDNINFKAIRLQLGLKPNDFVLINTSAVYQNYINFINLWLKLGKLSRANWFIHEDLGQCKGLIENLKTTLKPLLQKNQLNLLFPSKKTMLAYTKILGSKNLKSVTLRSEVPNRLKKTPKEDNFNSLNFLISGTSSDGRKGQLITISAFQRFYDTYYKSNPNKYRDFRMTMISVATEDYISRQVRSISKSTLGDHIEIHENMERSKALRIASKNNIVICSSLHETYALYVAESMLMGSVVIRSDVGGVDEQLKDGENGFAIDTQDIQQFSNVIEKILNKEKMSNRDLLNMSKKSIEMAKDFESSNYADQISID